MGATISAEALGNARMQLAGYAGAAVGVIRNRERPLWFITAVDVLAVIVAFGAMRAVSDMVLGGREFPQGVTVQETKGDMTAEGAAAANTTVLPRLASKARAAIAAVPEELILFAGPSPFTGRFGTTVDAPDATGFAAAAAEEAPAPTFAYVPPPRPARTPPVVNVVAVAERGAAATVEFATPTTRDVATAVGNSAGDTSRTGATEARGGGVAGATVQAVASAPAAATATAGATVGAVGGTVGAVVGLLD